MADTEDKNEKKPGGHNLSDHLYGQNLVHEHDEDTDHDHDHDYDFENDEVPLEDNPLWRQDNVSLTRWASTSAPRARRSSSRACICAGSPRT